MAKFWMNSSREKEEGIQIPGGIHYRLDSWIFFLRLQQRSTCSKSLNQISDSGGYNQKADRKKKGKKKKKKQTDENNKNESLPMLNILLRLSNMGEFIMIAWTLKTRNSQPFYICQSATPRTRQFSQQTAECGSIVVKKKWTVRTPEGDLRAAAKKMCYKEERQPPRDGRV